MNFLAHIYLSGHNQAIQIGNFIADSVKGRDLSLFPAEVSKGIMLHRKIDEYTDTHPIVFESKRRLYNGYGKYAGVIVDIFYDHFLATQWTQYSQVSLDDYAQQFYELLYDHQAILPERTLQMLPYLKSQNWLLSYAHVEGISVILERMSRRTRFNSNMELAGRELVVYYNEFQDEFNRFFPQLEHFVEQTIEQGL